ncbi:SMAD/FHA domain-containing protein [Cokeromyces recurvatus]|uniref:SMAD/FHA domain-containing protein n=1 Tax=Cokeromyces recurvatus TaxID=90255 RepID=UPI00221EB94B|nr:SMAD/FHA domain-containing protein [Cokeromyces recurvatus]KAI7903034.1 SMAD/FHA domain-containing protein [Cokeromyces recurvatus]
MSDQTFAVPALPSKRKQQEEANEQQQQQKSLPIPPPLKYEKPSWSAEASFNYRIEVLKNGQSIETIEGPKKEFITIGRLPLCDILMEHPSISRYHAVIQFDHDGEAYIYDLDSAHGTKVNKKVISARDYVLLKPGDQIRFGESTRICIFDSEKPYDPEAEAEAQKEKAFRQRLAKARGEIVPQEEGEDEGITWGFAEDAVEEDDDDDDDVNNQEEGYMGMQDIMNNLDKSGDAKLLDIEAAKMSVEDAKRRREDLDIMYGEDSDEELYDKTRKKNKKKEQKAETHEELVIKERQTKEKIKELEKEIEEKKKQEKKDKEVEEDLDAYMENLTKKSTQNEKSVFALQKELNNLKKSSSSFIELL